MTSSGSYVTVRLEGGCPWGFRLQGGAGSGNPLTVSKVRRKSKAFYKLLADDLVVSCNGKSCSDLNYDEVMRMADAGGPTLTLEVYRDERPKKRRLLDFRKLISYFSSDDRCKRVNEEEVATEYRSKITKQTEGHTIKPIPSLPRLPKPFLKMDTEQPAKEDIPEESPFSETPAETMETEISSEINGTLEQPIDEETEKPNSETAEGAIPQAEPEASAQKSDEPEQDTTTQKSVSKEISTEGDAVTSTVTEAAHQVDGETETNIVKQDTKTVAPGCVTESSNTLVETKTEKASVNGPLFETSKFEQNSVLENCQSFSSSVMSSSSVVTSQMSSFVTDATSEQDHPSLGMNTFTGVIRDSFQLNPKIYRPPPDMQGTDLTLFTRRKKMFSSSSFYEEPNSIYPTVEEQVELCRKIADSLSADTNKRSRGANMFYKRVNKSQKWIHEGPDPIGSDSDPYEGIEPSTPDPSKSPYVRVSKGPPKLKLILDPRQIQDMVKLRSSGQDINEHNAISPDICLGIVKDLNSPTGKGAILFAKRKKKSEEWIVDEEIVKSHLRSNYSAYDYPKKDRVPNQRLAKNPWEAALKSPYVNVHPDDVAETVIRVAEEKVNTPAPFIPPTKPQTNFLTKPRKQPSPFTVSPYRPRAPRGWSGTPDALSVHSDSELLQTSKSMSNIFQHEATPKYCFQNNFNNTAKAWTGASYSPFNFKSVKPPSLLIK